MIGLEQSVLVLLEGTLYKSYLCSLSTICAAKKLLPSLLKPIVRLG